MARGRMLNRSIGVSRKFDDLVDDTCRLLATWIIPHLDYNGVFYADPCMVKSLVFPRRADVSVEQVDAYLHDMARVGLVLLFKDAAGEDWQCWPGFADNQPGLRAERESTDFPVPDGCRQVDGSLPAECRQDAGHKAAREMPAEVEGEVEVEVQGEVKPSALPGAKAPDTSPPKPKTGKPKAPDPPTAARRALFAVLAQVCGLDQRLKRGQLNAATKLLADNGYTAEQVQAFPTWWGIHDWRGKKGQRPTLGQVVESLPQSVGQTRAGQTATIDMTALEKGPYAHLFAEEEEP